MRRHRALPTRVYPNARIRVRACMSMLVAHELGRRMRRLSWSHRSSLLSLSFRRRLRRSMPLGCLRALPPSRSLPSGAELVFPGLPVVGSLPQRGVTHGWGYGTCHRALGAGSAPFEWALPAPGDQRSWHLRRGRVPLELVHSARLAQCNMFSVLSSRCLWIDVALRCMHLVESTEVRARPRRPRTSIEMSIPATLRESDEAGPASLRRFRW